MVTYFSTEHQSILDMLDDMVNCLDIGRSSIQRDASSCTKFVQLVEPLPVQGFFEGTEDDDELYENSYQEELSQNALMEEDGKEEPCDDSTWPEDPSPSPFPVLWQVDEDSNNESYDLGTHEHYLGRIDEDCQTIELEKQLARINSTPHIPRINGDIPTSDNASADRHRLLDRLEQYGFTERKMQGDGNCQFRAISDQLHGTPDYHDEVRCRIVKQLRSHPECYAEHVPMDYPEYLEKMGNDGEWGDHVTLQAAADAYNMRIWLLTSFKEKCFIEISPKQQTSNQVIFLSFWAEVHYNSIVMEEGSSKVHNLKKKRTQWHRFFKRI